MALEALGEFVQVDGVPGGVGPVADGLLACYKHDRGSGTTAADAASTNDGTISGAVYDTPRTGLHSLSFDGTDDYVDISGFGTSSSAVSVSTVFYSNSWSTDPRIVFWGDDPDQFEMTYRDGIQWLYYDGSSYGIRSTSTGPTLSTGAWHHVVGVYDSNATDPFEVYVDGTSAATNSDTVSPSITGALNQIGNHGGTSRPFDGRIDETRFYGRALSASEVSELATHYGF